MLFHRLAVEEHGENRGLADFRSELKQRSLATVCMSVAGYSDSRVSQLISYLKRLTNATSGRLQAFRLYGGLGMSASSLHRESTDSLIYGKRDFLRQNRSSF